MGKLIEKLAPEFGFEVCSRIDSEAGDSKEISHSALKDADVAIEFTIPDAAPINLELLAGFKVPTVCGTTGWQKHLAQVRTAYQNSNTTLIYGSNFSIGVNVFDRVV